MRRGRGRARASGRHRGRRPAARRGRAGPRRRSPGQMSAEEGQIRIGHRIDARPDQVAALGPKPQEAPRKGTIRGSLGAPAATASLSDQAPAQRSTNPASVRPHRMQDSDPAGAGGQRGHPAPRDDRAAGALDVTGEGSGHLREVDHAGFRGVGARSRGRANSISAISSASPVPGPAPDWHGCDARARSARQLGFAGCNDQLPVRRASIPRLLAILVEQRAPSTHSRGLERSWRVDPGVDHAARVGRLVSGEPAPARARRGSHRGVRRAARARPPARGCRRRSRRCLRSAGLGHRADRMTGLGSGRWPFR